MHTEYTRLFFVCLKSLKLFKIHKALTDSSRCIELSNKNFASVILNLLSFSAPVFRFKVFFTKNTTSQGSVDGFKVSVVHLIGSLITVIWLKKLSGSTQGVRLETMSVL